MNYLQFKTYLANFLWRPNDANLIANLDTLVLMATSELRRRLLVKDRELVATISATANPFPAPSGFTHMIELRYNGIPLKRVESYQATDFTFDYYAGTTSPTVGDYYYVGNQLIYFQGQASVEVPVSFSMRYRSGLPALSGDIDTSWLIDDYIDLYIYAVLKHTAPYLREDERVALWTSLYENALQSANEEAAHEITRGGTPSRPSLDHHNW